ncbi:hypothetical protein V8D89_001857 [Ganoderma adspersum]
MSEYSDSLRTISDSSSSFASDSDLDEYYGIRWRRPDLKAHAKFRVEREHILRIICDYQTHLNLHTHVGQLPNELLAEIFDHFVSGCYESVRRGSAFRSRSHWIMPAHVCRRWRTVALSTATFWSFIFVHNSEAFSTLVARSMSAPLHIVARPMDRSLAHYTPHLWSFERPIDPAILEGIVAESHRIRELCIEGKVSDLQFVCTKLCKPLQSLELLRLSTSSKRNLELLHPPPSLNVIPIDGLAPRLRYLEIVKLSVKWSDPIFKCSSLTTLIVHGVLDRPHPFHDAPFIGTVPQLLGVLDRIASGLRVLSLDEAIPPLPLDTTSPPAPSRNISFPSLQSLHLAGRIIDTANLFNHLSPIPTSTVRLESRDSIEDVQTRIATTGVEAVARHLSQHVGRADALSSVRIELFCQTWHVTCCRTADLSGPPPVLLTLEASYGQHEEMPVTALFRGSGNMFANVQCLSIVEDTFDLDWAFLFARLPRLQSLKCYGHPFGPFFQALGDVQPDESGELRVPLPELRTLRLIDALFRRLADTVEREFVDELIDWAILRCNYGSPLETLELGSCAHAVEADVDLLAEIVTDVGWDGWDSDADSLEVHMGDIKPGLSPSL